MKEFFNKVNLDHIETAIVAGLTKHGSYFTATHKKMDIKTLRKLHKMIAQDIRAMRQEQSNDGG